MKIINKFLALVLLTLFVTTNKINAVSINIPNQLETSSFSELVEKVLGWLLSVAGSLALLMLIAGGIMYVTSAGDEQKVANSKKLITWTVLGLMLVLASYSIIMALHSILT